MNGLIETEELAEFNLDNLPAAARANLLKVARLLSSLNYEEWQKYIRADTIDLKSISNEAKVSRSSIYQNSHIKKYLLIKARHLHAKGLISVLPYKGRESTHSINAAMSQRKSTSNSVVREKNSVTEQLARAQNEIKMLRSKLRFYAARDEHIFSTGKAPY